MIEKLTRDLITKIVYEIRKEDNKKKIKEDIIYPILCEFSERMYPYITILFIMYMINLVLIIFTLFMITKKHK